jgi:hypothetical protein
MFYITIKLKPELARAMEFRKKIMSGYDTKWQCGMLCLSFYLILNSVILQL